MKINCYLVITQTEDGIYINNLTREQVTHQLNNQSIDGTKVMNYIPKFDDGQFAKLGTMILEVSRVVVPKEVKSVTEYTIEE